MRRMTLAAVVLAAGSAWGSAAAADTLREAMAGAYLNNPTLNAQRAAKRVVDETVPQAKSGWRPTVQITTSAGATRTQSGGQGLGGVSVDSTTNVRPWQVRLSVTQPLYRGGRTAAGTREAEANVEAADEQLRATEQNVLLGAVTAYLDVLRDESLVELNRGNVRVLQRQLQATRDRFEVGEVTRTDVSQAEARVSRAEADLQQAVGNLESSRATYERVVGHPPGRLAPVAPFPGLPRSEREAREIAVLENPSLRGVAWREEASYHAVRGAKGGLLPTVSLQGDLTKSENTGVRNESESASITAQATIPLYQQGAQYSRLRQSMQTYSQRRIELEEQRRDVLEDVTQAWARLTTSSARIASGADQVRAAEVALEGVRQELQVGSRTTLDVLDAEQELLDARVALITAERDEYVASFSLRAAIGRLTADSLALGVEPYDADVYYARVRNKWFGADVRDFAEYPPAAPPREVVSETTECGIFGCRTEAQTRRPIAADRAIEPLGAAPARASARRCRFLFLGCR